jgi:hypothetical protein
MSIVIAIEIEVTRSVYSLLYRLENCRSANMNKKRGGVQLSSFRGIAKVQTLPIVVHVDIFFGEITAAEVNWSL